MPDTRRRTLQGQQGHAQVRTAGGKNVGGSTETGLARLASSIRNATAGAVNSVGGDAVAVFSDGGTDSFTEAAQAVFEFEWSNTGRWDVHADVFLGSTTAVVPAGGAFLTFTVTLGIPGDTGLTSRSYPLGLPEGAWNISGIQLPVDCFDDTAGHGDTLARYLGLTVAASGSTAVGGTASLSVTGERRA